MQKVAKRGKPEDQEAIASPVVVSCAMYNVLIGEYCLNLTCHGKCIFISVQADSRVASTDTDTTSNQWSLSSFIYYNALYWPKTAVIFGDSRRYLASL